MFEVLLECGADPSGSNDGYDHWSPLMIAIQRGRDEMRDELRRRRARVGLTEALLLGDDRLVDDLLRDGRLPAIVPNGGSLVAFARTPHAIDRLLDLGADAAARDRWGSTPMEAFSAHGAAGAVLARHLIARGVSAAPRDHARMRDREALARLVEADSSVARLDDVMMAAVEGGHHALVAWLLAQGANASARTDRQSRQTALHVAAWNGDLEMTRLLVEAGADRLARDEEHQATPRVWAETSVTVSGNRRALDVVAYFDRLPPPA